MTEWLFGIVRCQWENCDYFTSQSFAANDKIRNFSTLIHPFIRFHWADSATVAGIFCVMLVSTWEQRRMFFFTSLSLSLTSHKIKICVCGITWNMRISAKWVPIIGFRARAHQIFFWYICIYNSWMTFAHFIYNQNPYTGIFIHCCMSMSILFSCKMILIRRVKVSTIHAF